MAPGHDHSARSGRPSLDLEAATLLRRQRLACVVGWSCAGLWAAIGAATQALYFGPRDQTGFFNVNSTLSEAALYAAGALALLAHTPVVALAMRGARRAVDGAASSGADAAVGAIHAARRGFSRANAASLATGLAGLALFLATGNGAAFGFLLVAACVGHFIARPNAEWERAFARVERSR